MFTDLALGAAALPPLVASGYLALLALAARHAPPPQPSAACTFDVLVPAHNEAAGIAATIASLYAMDYPPERFRVIVIADNCTDDTAARARAAGAVVLDRDDSAHRGKGYALAFGYAATLTAGHADAVVVVDADTLVSPNLLGAFAARLATGADAAQAEYGVRRVDPTTGGGWRLGLMTVALALYHTTRSLGRERLGLSCGLRGNGMAFTADLLRRVPHTAVSLVEDVEYGVALGMAGVRVAHVAEASVWGDMPSGGAGARTQRERWERGRQALARLRAPALLRAAFGPSPGPAMSVRPSRVLLLDLAADLLVPPLTTLVAAAVTGLAVTLALYRAGLAGPIPVALWMVGPIALLGYVTRGCVLARVGWRGMAALVAAPLYAAWKLSLRFRRGAAGGAAPAWIRTARPTDHA